MPDTILPDEGLIQQHMDSLQMGISGRLPWKLLLWVNDIVPDSATVLSDLIEATFGGYLRSTIYPANWTAFDALGGCSHAQWGLSPVVWPVTSGPLDTIYGWALIDELAGVIRRVQRFDDDDIAPVVVGEPVAFQLRSTYTTSAC